MQDETAVDLDRTAVMHWRGPKIGIAERHLDLLEQRGKRHVDRLVDHDAERAFFVVLADIDQCMREMGIGHAGHGDQEMVGQIDPRFTHAAASAG